MQQSTTFQPIDWNISYSVEKIPVSKSRRAAEIPVAGW